LECAAENSEKVAASILDGGVGKVPPVNRKCNEKATPVATAIMAKFDFRRSGHAIAIARVLQGLPAVRLSAKVDPKHRQGSWDAG
jgi:hypothetical protein